MSFLKPIRQKIRNGSKKLVKEIEKLKIYCTGGYKKIQPRVFGRGVLTMVHPSIIESEEGYCNDHFRPSLGSLKKREVIDSNSYQRNVQPKSHYNKVELPEKEVLLCQIVPCEGKAVDHAYDVRFQKITPCSKLAQFRRQSTAPEFF